MAADGHAALDAQIRRLRELENLVPDAAPAVANTLDKEIRHQIARGVGPDGQRWKPTKKGERPLQNAAKALTVRPVGNVVLATLEGPEALHHLGRARGGVRREILPTGKIPEPMTKAITKVIEERFTKTMGGR